MTSASRDQELLHAALDDLVELEATVAVATDFSATNSLRAQLSGEWRRWHKELLRSVLAGNLSRQAQSCLEKRAHAVSSSRASGGHRVSSGNMGDVAHLADVNQSESPSSPEISSEADDLRGTVAQALLLRHCCRKRQRCSEKGE